MEWFESMPIELGFKKVVKCLDLANRICSLKNKNQVVLLLSKENISEHSVLIFVIVVHVP